MMKKAIKKLLAALLAVAMLCAMAIPAFAYDTEEVRAHHSFEAFQIFQGDVSRSSRVMLVMTIRRFPTLSGAKTSLILPIFWRN